MDINSLISFEDIGDFEKILCKAEELGEVIILKNNKPAYRIMPIASIKDNTVNKRARSRIDLWEAMDIVLSESSDNIMHAKDIANEITVRELYFKKDGSPVQATQIRARAGHKPEYFECLRGNYIRLKMRYKK